MHRALLCLLAIVACSHQAPYSPVERGEAALAMGENADAADAYRDALAFRPDDPHALLGMARTELNRGRAERALDLLFQVRQRDPVLFEREAREDQRAALELAARDRFAIRDHSAALRYLRRLQEVDPAHPALRDLLPEVLIAEAGRQQLAGRTEEAERLFREAQGRDPDRVDPTLAYAEALLARGRADTAISLLGDALERHPDDPRLRELLDRALEIRYPDPIQLP